jgi:hypothetical protein
MIRGGRKPLGEPKRSTGDPVYGGLAEKAPADAGHVSSSSRS